MSACPCCVEEKRTRLNQESQVDFARACDVSSTETERTPATWRSPETERTPATGRSPETERTPATGRSPETQRTPANREDHDERLAQVLVLALLLFCSRKKGAWTKTEPSE
jgi:hypothetical protein